MANTKSAMKKPSQPDKIERVPTGAYDGVIRAAMEISRRQTADLRRIQEALNKGDDATALVLMKAFFVINHDGSMNENLSEQIQ